MALPNCGVNPPLRRPQRAPRPNKKFLIPVQPVLKLISVIIAMTEQIRLFIFFSFICIACVFGSLIGETTKN